MVEKIAGNRCDVHERVPALLIGLSLGVSVAIVREPAMLTGLGR
jgi:hypothetical protein